MAIDFGMLEMMKVNVKEGRLFSEKYASDTINSIMINETALKMMNEKNPIGKTQFSSKRWLISKKSNQL